MFKNITKLLTIFSLFATTTALADNYNGKLKYFKKETIYYLDDIPREVQSTNISGIYNKVEDEYIITYKKDNALKKSLEKSINEHRAKLYRLNKELKELKYSNNSHSFIEREKRVYLSMINEQYDLIKEKEAGIVKINKDKVKGMKVTGIFTKIKVNQGQILLTGTPIAEKIDETIARIKIEINQYDYENIEYMRIRKNNIIVKRDNIKVMKKTGKDYKTRYYLIIEVDVPTKYALEKEYTIKID